MTIPTFELRADVLENATIERIQPDPDSSQTADVYGRGFRVTLADNSVIEYVAYIDGRCQTNYSVSVDGQRLWEFKDMNDSVLSHEFRAVCAELAHRHTDRDISAHEDRKEQALNVARSVFKLP